MAHEDQFTATGPSNTGSGFPRAGFSTHASDMVYGVNVQGGRCGVFGESVSVSSGRESSVEGVGVHGFGENFGVFGNGNRGISGVFGEQNRGGVGVIGASMRGGTGVFGVSLASLGNPLETFESLPVPADGSGSGVFGASGRGYGVEGDSQDNAGVVGRSTISTGVWGRAIGEGERESGYGVLGESVVNAGVVGRSEQSVGVWGSVGKSFGVLGDSVSGFGVVGRCPDGVGVYGQGPTAGHFAGTVVVDGDLMVTGAKGAVMPHPDGSHRLLCAVESPESWFEDFGEARLQNGVAQVPLDPDFALVIETTDYHVFLSAYGDCNGLYVAARMAHGFEVREQHGGLSACGFAYRIVGRRKNSKSGRLAKLSLPAHPSAASFQPQSLAPATPAKPRTPLPHWNA